MRSYRNSYLPDTTRRLAILLAAQLFHTQLALAAGCDLPTFGGARLFAAASSATAMAIGDFDRDGVADLAVLNQSGSISILLGKGDGTFQPGAIITVKSPHYLATADFNGDGNLDLAVDDGSIFRTVVLPGKGDGTFGAQITAGSQTGDMAVGDFNGDGKPDLVLVGVPAYVLLSRGDGTFQNPIGAAGGLVAALSMATGDVNGDGRLDVVAAGASGSILVMLGDGRGSLAAPVTFGGGSPFGATNLAVGDLNGDKKLDVVAVNSLARSVSVLLGNGDGNLQAPVAYALGDLSTAVAIGDFNGDGVPDLAVSNHASNFEPGTISVFAGQGDGAFQAPVQYNPTAQANWALATGDFNGDGLPDLVFTSIVQDLPTQVGVLFGSSGGVLQSPRAFTSGGTLPRTPALADLNGDGVLDMAVANAGVTGSNLAVLIGNPDGSFQAPVTYPTAFGAKSVAIGDMNGDGKLDLVVTNGASANLLVFLGNGDGTFQPSKPSSAFFGASYVGLGDFNKDGRLDAVVMGVAAQFVFGNGDGTFRSGAAFGSPCSGCGPGPVLVTDMNGDGNLDLVMANGDTDLISPSAKSGTVTVALGKGDGTFLTGVDYMIGSNASAVAVGDLNGDGAPDLAVSDFGGAFGRPMTAGAMAILLNKGDGSFLSAVRYASGKGASNVVVSDFNGDGMADVAVLGRTSKTVTVYLGNGDGSVRNAISYGAGGDPVGLAVADVNGDGKPDLLFSDQLANTIGTLLNTLIPGAANSACVAVPALVN